MSKKLIALLLAAMMLLAMAAACGNNNANNNANNNNSENNNSENNDTPSTDNNNPTPAQPAKKVYYSVLGSDHSSLNFLDNVDTPVETVATYCMSYLYRTYPNEDGMGYHYICDIAAEMPIQVDEYNWDIKIREDAKWNDGTPINADTFMFTFQQQLNPKMGARMATFLFNNAITIKGAQEYFEQGVDGNISWDTVGIQKMDDYTIRITTTDTNTADQVCNHFYQRNLVPVNEKLWNECLSADGATTSYGSDLSHFIGCGPYNFTTWDYDSIQIYTKNPDHWLSDLFNYDEVQIRIVPEMNARVELWEQNLLDSLSPNAETLERYIDDPRLVEYGSISVYHLDINCKNPNNPISGSDNYRKAIYHALNREVIAKELFGHMEPAGWYVNSQAGLLSENALTYRESKYGKAVEEMVAGWSAEGSTTGYNPELALEYFDKACEECNVSKDTVINIIMAYDPSDTAWHKTAQYLQQEFPVIFNNRVTVEIKNYSGISTTAYKQQGDDGWDLSPNDWGRSMSRTYPFQCFYYFTSGYDGSPNNYFNADFDAQYDYCSKIQNGDYDTLLQETQKLEEIYLEHVIQCPVVQDVSYELHAERLVLPVKTYIPGFGWGNCYGDINE